VGHISTRGAPRFRHVKFRRSPCNRTRNRCPVNRLINFFAAMFTCHSIYGIYDLLHGWMARYVFEVLQRFGAGVDCYISASEVKEVDTSLTAGCRIRRITG